MPKVLQFDQKTKPYILAAFRDVKTLTPRNIAVTFLYLLERKACQENSFPDDLYNKTSLIIPLHLYTAKQRGL